LQKKQYSAVAQLLMQPTGGTIIGSSQQSVSPTDVLTELQLITSAQVRAKATSKLGFPPNLSASEAGETNIINVTATASKPSRAAHVANVYAQLFVSYQQTNAVRALTSAEQQYESQINAVEAQIQALQSSSSSSSSSSASAAAASSTIAALAGQESVLKEDLAQLQVAASQSPGGIELASPATVPTAPSSPRPLRDALLALVIGLILGVAAAFAAEYFDNKVYTKDEAERFANGSPVLAMIPKMKTWKKPEQALLITQLDAFSPVTESYRALRTSLQFVCAGKTTKQVLVTSASGAEGKTSTVANLATVLATAGERVVVVGCDLRRPRIGQFFQQSETPGLTSVLLDQVTIEDAVKLVRNPSNLSLLASGPVPPNPAELLGSERAAEVFDWLANHFDMVLIDSPPLLPVTDSLILAGYSDAVLLVVEAGETKRSELQRACELLEQVSVRPTGLVLNSLVRRSGDASEYGYAYDSSYKYGHPPNPVSDVATNGAGHVRPAVPSQRRVRKSTP
jgi:capsular exopolysaccharide synthesis family protein